MFGARQHTALCGFLVIVIDAMTDLRTKNKGQKDTQQPQKRSKP